MKISKISLVFIFLSISLASAQTVQEQASEILPDFKAGNFGLVITLFFASIVVLGLIGTVLFLTLRHFKFNKHITIWEDVEGSDGLEPIGTDKAMLIKVGKGGTELLYLKKRKTYKGAYGKRIGKNKYFFVIGKDGYWYNTTLGSLDSAMQKININPTNVNMRYQNEALMELIRERYEKPNFWEQYGQILVNLAFFMLIAVMFWLYFSSFKEVAPALVQASDTLKESAEALKQVIGGIDNLRASGGITPT